MVRTEKNQKKKKFSLPVSAWISYFLLLAFVMTGVTFSKYVTASRGGDSARVAQMKNIEVTETGNFSAPNEWIITPGADMTKNATIRFDGSELACYVFAEIQAEGWKRTSKRDFSYTDGDKTLMSWSIAETPLTFLKGDENGAVYYAVVPAKTVFETSLIADGGRIAVSEDITRSLLEAMPENMTIGITATAVQYHGFSEKTGDGYTAEERAIAAYETIKNK